MVGYGSKAWDYRSSSSALGAGVVAWSGLVIIWQRQIAYTDLNWVWLVCIQNEARRVRELPRMNLPDFAAAAVPPPAVAATAELFQMIQSSFLL